MSIQTTFAALFPDQEFTGDDAALLQMREEVEVLRVQVGIRVGDVRRLFIEYVQTNPVIGAAGLLWLGREIEEMTQLILSRGKVPTLKGATELQRAHDVLGTVVLEPGLRRSIFDDASLEPVKANLDVLCWALGHDHNHTFAQNLAYVEAELFRRGLVVGK